MRTLVLVLVLAFVLVASASVASAQAIEQVIDLAGLGWGAITAQPIDTDANPSTDEWLVQPASDPRPLKFRVVAVRNGRLCIGDWFFPRLNLHGFALLDGYTVEKREGRDKLIFLMHFGMPEWRELTVVSLDTPECR